MPINLTYSACKVFHCASTSNVIAKPPKASETKFTPKFAFRKRWDHCRAGFGPAAPRYSSTSRTISQPGHGFLRARRRLSREIVPFSWSRFLPGTGLEPLACEDIPYSIVLVANITVATKLVITARHTATDVPNYTWSN